MEKSLFEQMGGTYTQVGDYLLPDLTLPKEEQKSIGMLILQEPQSCDWTAALIFYSYSPL